MLVSIVNRLDVCGILECINQWHWLNVSTSFPYCNNVVWLFFVGFVSHVCLYELKVTNYNNMKCHKCDIWMEYIPHVAAVKDSRTKTNLWGDERLVPLIATSDCASKGCSFECCMGQLVVSKCIWRLAWNILKWKIKIVLDSVVIGLIRCSKVNSVVKTTDKI